MKKEFLESVVLIVIGKQQEKISELLDTKRYVNEFTIAKKLDITINQTRNILYKLSDEGLVSYIRKKDKRKGWYTYFWKIEPFKALNFLRGEFLKRLEQVNNQIRSRETKVFYICERCNIEFSEENALLHDFSCVECGDVLAMRDNTKILKEFGKERNKLKKQIEEIDKEIINEEEKVEKAKLRAERKKPSVKKKQVAKKKPSGAKKPKSVKQVNLKKKTTKKVKSKKSKPVKKKSVKKKTTPPKTKKGKSKKVKSSRKSK